MLVRILINWATVATCALSLVQATNSFGQMQHQEPITLIDSVYFLSENLPVGSIQKESVLAQFQPLPKIYKFSGGNWICFRLSNPGSTQIPVILEIQSTVYFDLIELFKKEKGAMLSLGITGDPIHHSLGPMKDHGLLFPIVLPPVSTGNYFLHAISPIEFQLPLSIQSLQSFERRRNVNNLFYTFYYGFIAFVLVFSIFLIVIFPTERIYLFYSLYLLSLLFLFLHINGFGYEFLWPDWPEFDKRIPYLASSSSMIFLLRFTEQFLRPHQLKRIERKIFDFFFYTYCFSLLFSQFIFMDPLLQKVYLFVFISFVNISFFVVAWFIAFRIYKTGFKPALFYIIAFLFFFTSVSFYSARSIISISGWFSHNIIQLGNTIEVMVLTLGLAYWFKANQDEKQNLLLRVSRQQKEMADEKDRIARELHDSLGSRLSTIALSLQRASMDTGNKSLLSIQDMTDHAMNELRDSIWAMNKDSISLEELEQRINTLFWQYRKTNLPMELDMKIIGKNSVVRLTPDVGINLYRIFQEAVQNAIKHSGASLLEVSLMKGQGFVMLRIQDNGKGFQWPLEIKAEHYGLLNMKKRTEIIKAGFQVETAPGEGTKITIKVPVVGL